jgi:hypothetical protein
MESLKFEAADLETMRDFYREELKKTLTRLEHINGVLTKLGDRTTTINIQFEGAGQSAVSKKPVAPAAKETSSSRSKGKKRGPKSVWGTFILKRLQQLDKPLTYNQLVDEAMVVFKLEEEKRQSVVNAIINSAFRLRKNSGRIDTFSAGSREKFVALKSWFDEPGKISKDYLKKVDKPAKKTRAKRKANKPKTTSSDLASKGRKSAVKS